MKYLEQLPSRQLADHVKCFWSLEDEPDRDCGAPEAVIPDCCIEIVFNLADRFQRYWPQHGTEIQPASLVAGQIKNSIFIGPTGRVRLFGIRFHPTGAHRFFDFEMNSLANRIESLDSVWGSSVRQVEERLWSALSFKEQTVVAEMVLRERMRKPTNIAAWLNTAVASISEAHGTRGVRDVARDVDISERGLERRFNRYIGLNPKAFSRIVRFQSFLRAIGSARKPDILDIAYRFGYFDQSHLIRDFHQYSGMSPSAYLTKNRGITELFITA